MISDAMTDALNTQVNAEWYSAYLYLAMSAQCADMGLKGGAAWFEAQAREEIEHGLRIYKYVQSQGRKAVLAAIDGPPTEFDSLKAMFEASLEHEKKVTGLINALVDQARSENDHATEIFLQWFVTEQVEEEENVNDILARIELGGDTGGPLFMLDRSLGARGAGAA
ncbi:MAG: ferritin [Lentisphaerae bacterium]|nr:ferritin [Lentisphaerota bacterium]